MNFYLIFKSLHLIAVISWMAGLLYLPRIFVYHTENSSNDEICRVFKIMERKTNVIQGSNQHKNGLLYKDRQIIFSKKKIPKKLFKKKNLILFSGELIHGNGSNFDNRIRFSIDARMIIKNKITTPAYIIFVFPNILI